MKDFLKVIADKLQIGVRNDAGDVIGQGAMVTFSDDAQVRLTLTASRRAGEFVRGVSALPGPKPGGQTKTDIGLKLTDTEVAQRSAGLRDNDKDVKSLLVVLTDGDQTEYRGYVPVKDAIKPFFARDMEVFAIGVGLSEQKAIDQVNDMVEVTENALFPESYTDLINQVNDFVTKFCPGTVMYI